MMKTLLKATISSAFPLFFLLSIIGSSIAASFDLPDGNKIDGSSICPVCNMKIEAGNLGPAALVLSDGKLLAFDAAGDFFRYILEPVKYGADPKTFSKFFVTDHSSKKFIDAKQALYVTGSDITGGMGPEAVPFEKKEDAESFKSSHQGRSVLSFRQVTLDDLSSQKKILKMKHDHGK
jgi:copper chaperone NosL